MKRHLRVRTVPAWPHRNPQKVAQKKAAPTTHTYETHTCPVYVEVNGLSAELPINTREPALISQSARMIALMLRRWLKHQYGALVHLVSALGDAKIRYHRKLRTMVNEINRVLFGIVPQTA